MKKLSLAALRRISAAVMCALVITTAAVCFFSDGGAVMVSSKSREPIYFGNRNANVVALMFNCYEGEEQIRDICKTLKKYGFCATFFFGGCFADDHADLLKYLAENGNELGNHGYFHKAQGKLDYDGNYREIKTTYDVIFALTGIKTTLFAPPSGDFGTATLQAAEKLGYKTVMWTKDTVDWRDKDAKTVYNRATKNIVGGDFVLMHPKAHTAAALASVLDYYVSRGLCVGTVSQCIAES